jgi:hypothetical protein
MHSEIVRWAGAVALGVGYGVLVWLSFRLIPWLPDMALWPPVALGLALSLGLAWIGLPLVDAGRWDPQTPRAEAYERFRQWMLERSRRRPDPKVTNALHAGGLGAMLLLAGLAGSIFRMGSFSSSSGAGLRLLCFGGALACAAAAWAQRNAVGRVVALLVAALTLVTWSAFLR